MKSKLIYVGAALLLSSLSLAGEKSEKIYESLNVGAVQVSPLFEGQPLVGSLILEKSVGGLLCQKTTAVVPNPVPEYACYLSVEREFISGEAIYKALTVEEVNGGRNTRSKTVANLTCLAVFNDSGALNTTYSCELN